MVDRPPWTARIEAAWGSAPVCWLSGVRRVGKTTLCRALPGATYLNCDLPEVADELKDPLRFLRSLKTDRLVLDEVHQLQDPSRVLKIAADEVPSLRTVATGSSTLAATEKFKDSLTGRKRPVHLVPVLVDELEPFGVRGGLDWRLLAGGLPQPLRADRVDRGFYAEWLDSYHARDVRELFRVEKRSGFLTLLEAVLRQSGGLLEVTSMSKVSGLSRPTVMTYLEVMEVTHVITRLRPYSGGRSDRELVQAPKVYGFDTGFVCHARGIETLRASDRGGLLEHLVLETLQSVDGLPRLHHWRDKDRHEVDFILPWSERRVDAIEVKWDGASFDPGGLQAFRRLYPTGRNWLVTAQSRPVRERTYDGDLDVTSLSIEAFRTHLLAEA